MKMYVNFSFIYCKGVEHLFWLRQRKFRIKFGACMLRQFGLTENKVRLQCEDFFSRFLACYFLFIFIRQQLDALIDKGCFSRLPVQLVLRLHVGIAVVDTQFSRKSGWRSSSSPRSRKIGKSNVIWVTLCNILNCFVKFWYDGCMMPRLILGVIFRLSGVKCCRYCCRYVRGFIVLSNYISLWKSKLNLIYNWDKHSQLNYVDSFWFMPMIDAWYFASCFGDVQGLSRRAYRMLFLNVQTGSIFLLLGYTFAFIPPPNNVISATNKIIMVCKFWFCFKQTKKSTRILSTSVLQTRCVPP